MTVKRVNKAKSLRVIIDEKLNLDEMFKYAKGDMSGDLAALKRLKDVISNAKLCNVYNALIESHLRYGDVVWGSLSKTKIDALQHLLDRACSMIANARIKIVR